MAAPEDDHAELRELLAGLRERNGLARLFDGDEDGKLGQVSIVSV